MNPCKICGKETSGYVDGEQVCWTCYLWGWRSEEDIQKGVYPLISEFVLEDLLDEPAD